MSDLRNTYDDADYAGAYAKLEFPGTYYLAYRDLPAIVATHVAGRRVLDFGCGAGRSTRFVRGLGFEAVGVDIAADMVRQARDLDPAGDYRLLADEGLGALPERAFDLVLSVFTFDNIPAAAKPGILRALAGRLAEGGRIVILVSSPEIYTHEWASFSTRDFPENASARSGDLVRIVSLDIEDRRPAVDVLWTDESYREVYREAGLGVVAVHRPLAIGTEPYRWVNETRIAPWVVYVLKDMDRTR